MKTRPNARPGVANFSSGPCAKRPGWTLASLDKALLGRSHRSKPGKQKLAEVIDRTRAVQLGLPARSRRAMAELDSLIRVLEDECRECHAAYMHGRPALLKLCDAVIDAAGQSRSSAA